MQVFEWLTAYPDAVDKGVAIAGSPPLLEAERVRLREQVQFRSGSAAVAARHGGGRSGGTLAAPRAPGENPIDCAYRPRDQTVTPRPAAEFAHLAHAWLLQLEGGGATTSFYTRRTGCGRLWIDSWRDEADSRRPRGR
jgi:hypothetical protein